MSNVPYRRDPFLYLNGFELAYPSTAGEQLTVSIQPGNCRDSENVFQIESRETLILNESLVGAGGLDTGVVQSFFMYEAYILGDPTGSNKPAGMFALEGTVPVLPKGYTIFRKIGYLPNGTTNFFPGLWTGDREHRHFTFDDFRATAVTAGNEVVYTPVDLLDIVPKIEGFLATYAVEATPSAGGRVLSLQPFDGSDSGAMAEIVGQVGGVPLTLNVPVPVRLDADIPKIKYKWSAGGGDAVSIAISSFEYSL